MSLSNRRIGLMTLLAGLTGALIWAGAVSAAPPVQGEPLLGPPKKSSDKTKPEKKKAAADADEEDDKDADSDSKPKVKIRWGKRRNESDADYDKRFKRIVDKVKQDKKGDYAGGRFLGAKGEVRLWTYLGHPFIVRSDISKEFTADTAMYMEMLHRDYGEAYRQLLGVPADVREKIEVIVFSERDTYMRNGGTPGSGGFFNPACHLQGDRGPYWKARRYRLQQFTSGVTDFAKWDKGTLKHEAAHMELQLRLGNTLYANVIGFPVDAPRWWNEGHASVFEDWDFDKTIDENFKDVPNRGRYAPVIRRAYGTDKWKEFHYVWTIDPQTWHRDMTSEQGFLNYAQSWSLAGYMMSGGVKGKKDFQAIFNISKRVGTDRQTTYHGDRMIAWEDKFPEETRKSLEENWMAWVAENVSRDKRVPDEDYMLKRMGYNPEIVDRLEYFGEDEMKKVREEVEAETDRREKDPERIEK